MPSQLGWTHRILVAAAVATMAAQSAEIRVQPGDDLQAVLDHARAADVIVLEQGTWRGSFRIVSGIVFAGDRATLDGGGSGTVLTLDAPGITVRGIRIINSGRDLRGPDCGIYVTPQADHARIEGNQLKDCAFGIWVHETAHIQIRSNRIDGMTDRQVSNRGNGIHLFDATAVQVLDNQITHGRDGIYVSATEDSLIAGNRMCELRFGIHYMYSYDNRVQDNVSLDNKVGFALMESRGIVAERNTALRNQRQGLLFRDAQYCRIAHNRLEHNGEGMFFFSSTDNLIRANRIAHNQTGVRVWAGSYRNDVSENVFLGNRKQVFFVGTADLVWGEDGPGNFWSDYLGWDQDGDGLGDRPYRVNSFSSHLVYKYPVAALLMRSPGLELLNHLEEKLPVLKVPTIIDRAPLTRIPKP